MKSSIIKFFNDNNIYFLENEKISNHLNFKVGGFVDFLFIPKNIQELQKVYKFVIDKNIKYFILGKGSNVIFSDNVFKGIVIKITDIEKSIIQINDNTFEIGSSVPMTSLPMYFMRKQLSGFEFSGSIPGNVGGAIYMNAGAHEQEISDIITKIKYLDENGDIVEMIVDDNTFKYRYSIFHKMNWLILSGTFKLLSQKQDKIKSRIIENKNWRLEKQPTKTVTFGSVFKNGTESSWKLIDSVGMRNQNIGDIFVSEFHANFFENKGNGTATDTKKLIDLIKIKVQEKYNIKLETEVELINFDE